MAKKPSDQAVAKTNAMKQALDDLAHPTNMKYYGELLADMIRKRALLGDGVEKVGEDKRKFKPLSPQYIEERRALQKQGKLSNKTTPAKSNLTSTGELLDSIRVKQVSKGRVTIGPFGMRADGKSNAEVAQHLANMKRAFNNPSKTELKRINNEIRKDFRALLKARLTKAK